MQVEKVFSHESGLYTAGLGFFRKKLDYSRKKLKILEESGKNEEPKYICTKCEDTEPVIYSGKHLYTMVGIYNNSRKHIYISNETINLIFVNIIYQQSGVKSNGTTKPLTFLRHINEYIKRGSIFI